MRAWPRARYLSGCGCCVLGGFVGGAGRVGHDLRQRRVAAALLPDRGEQPLELLALGWIEAVEHVVLDAVHHLGDLVDHSEALLRDLDKVAAAVAGIAAARRVAAL